MTMTSQPIRIIFPDATDTATGHDAPIIRRFAEMPEDRELQALMLRYNATTCHEA